MTHHFHPDLEPKKNPYTDDRSAQLFQNSWKILLFGAVILLTFTAFALFYLKLNQLQNSETQSGISNGGEHLGSAEKLVLQGYLSLYTEQLLEPAGSLDEQVEFTINSGESAATIIANLITEGIISPEKEGLLLNYLSYYNLDAQLVAGRFYLAPKQNIPELAVQLTNPIAEDVTLVFLEGLRMEEYANYLAVTKPAAISSDEFLQIVKRQRPFDLSKFPALRDLDASDSLEGFLMPDTYRVRQDATAEDLVIAMLTNFEARLTPIMRDQISAKGMSIRDVLNVAAIVQREAVLPEERPEIASAFLNRLEVDMPLQADPTVQYALGNDGTGNWWKSPLFLGDLEVDSPYNTYRNRGLPPSPIANPSIDTIGAVISPADTEYIFFVADCDPERPSAHLFSVTFEEHQENVAKCIVE